MDKICVNIRKLKEVDANVTDVILVKVKSMIQLESDTHLSSHCPIYKNKLDLN